MNIVIIVVTVIVQLVVVSILHTLQAAKGIITLEPSKYVVKEATLPHTSVCGAGHHRLIHAHST